MKYLYKKSRSNENVPVQDDLKIEIMTPTIRNLTLKEEQKSIKLLVVRIIFWVLTMGKARLYICRKGGKLVHTSYVIPKCCKFPFLSNVDYEIGPCMTYPAFRGKGYYPMMLRYISSTVGTEKTVFYMIVDEDNIASIKGIEKAGFQRCGNVYVTKIMKQYCVIPDKND